MHGTRETAQPKVAKARLSTKDLCRIALAAVLIAVCSWISISLVVPHTMQTFGVFAALGLLGGRKGTIAVALYLLMGALGLPVFAGFAGGPGILLGATGGYLIGFLFAALAYWAIERLFGTRHRASLTGMALGLLLCYAFGTFWYLWVYSAANGAISVGTAVGRCVLPFIAPDCGKIALSLLIRERLRKYLLIR